MDWNSIQNVLSNIVFGILLSSLICSWIDLSFWESRSFLTTINRYGTLFANILLFLILGSRWIIAGYFPLSNLYESLLFLTWILLTIQLIMEIKTKSKIISATIIPITLFINGFANLTLTPEMQKSSPLVPALQSNWLMLHVSMMLLSYATLITGALLCILFLIITRQNKNIIILNSKILRACKVLVNVKLLKKKSTILNIENVEPKILKLFEPFNQIDSKMLEFIGRLVMIRIIDNWSYRLIGLGFPFLTIGIISGGVWANEAWGSYWSWDPKETWALITWLVFATYLHARLTKGWTGKKAAILGAFGFIVIWICYLGVNFLGKGLHSYGWLS